jgi:hypothetical protein
MFLSVDHALLLIILNPYLHLGRGSRFHNHIKEVRYTILIFTYFYWIPEGTDTEVSSGNHFPNCLLVRLCSFDLLLLLPTIRTTSKFQSMKLLLQGRKFQYSAEGSPLFWPKFCDWNTNVNSVPLRFLLEHILSTMRVRNEVHRTVDRTMSEFPFSSHYCCPLQPPLSYLIQPTGRVTREVCNVIQTKRKHFCDHNRWTTSRGEGGAGMEGLIGSARILFLLSEQCPCLEVFMFLQSDSTLTQTVTARYWMFPSLPFIATDLKETILIQDRKYTNNVTLKRFPETIVTVEKQ